MLTLYIISAIVAGGLVILSVIGGGHDSDHDAGGHDADHDASHDGMHEPWMPFFSLRFYTYFLAAFGLTGLLLHYLTDTPAITGAWIAGGVGFASGLVVAWLFRLLKVSEASGNVTSNDFLGKEAQVLVPIRGTLPGQVRCVVGGDIIDLTATTDEQRTIEVGEKVVVVSMENGRAQVALPVTIFGSSDPEEVKLDANSE